MSSRSRCQQMAERLIERASTRAVHAADGELERHLVQCQDCRRLAERLTAMTGALADVPEPLSPAVQQRQIAAALAGPRTSVASPRRRWAFALAGAAAALALGVILRPHQEAADLLVIDGTLAMANGPLASGARRALREPLAFEATRQTQLRLGDGSNVQMAAGTRGTLAHERGWRWQLRQGELRLSVHKQPAEQTFSIATPDAEVMVVGTRFDTRATPQRGTWVSVHEGVVQVTARATHESRRLSAGQEWSIGSAAPPASPVPETAPGSGPGDSTKTPAVVPSAPAAPVHPSGAPRSRAADANVAPQIRAQIASGQLEAARRLIASTRARAGDRGDVLAEMGMLDAEASLAERKFAQAIDGYLAVASRYPRTSQAEQALFAAAQISSDHPEAGRDPDALLRRYQRLYPKGAFRVEVARLLNAGPR